MEWIELVQSVVYLALVVILGYAGRLLRNRARSEKLIIIQEELRIKEEQALEAVKYAQQAWKHLNGPERYTKAIFWLTTVLEDKGIEVSEYELRGKIESALRDMKDMWGEEWGKLKEK